MNLILIAFFVALLCVCVLESARRLFEMGSTLARFIYRYGIIVAIVEIVVLIFANSAEDILSELSVISALVITLVSTVVLVAIEFGLDACRRGYLEPPRDKRGRIIKQSFAHKNMLAVIFIDSIMAILGGFAVGASFAMNIGAGLTAAVAYSVLVVLHNVNLVELYQNTIIDSEKIKNVVSATYAPFVIALMLGLVIARCDNYFGAILETVAFGYLISFCLRQGRTVVKKYLNR